MCDATPVCTVLSPVRFMIWPVPVWSVKVIAQFAWCQPLFGSLYGQPLIGLCQSLFNLCDASPCSVHGVASPCSVCQMLFGLCDASPCSVHVMAGLCQSLFSLCDASLCSVCYNLVAQSAGFRCEKALLSSVNVTNCIQFYQTAEEMCAETLRNHCSELISNHWVRIPLSRLAWYGTSRMHLILICFKHGPFLETVYHFYDMETNAENIPNNSREHSE